MVRNHPAASKSNNGEKTLRIGKIFKVYVVCVWPGEISWPFLISGTGQPISKTHANMVEI